MDHTNTYRELVRLSDEAHIELERKNISSQPNSVIESEFQEVVKSLSEFSLHADLNLHADVEQQIESIQKLNKQLRQMLSVRRSIIEQKLISYPSMNAFYGEEASPNDEEMKELIAKCDEQTMSILNSDSLIKSKDTPSVPTRTPFTPQELPDQESEDDNRLKDILYGLIASSGLDWSKNERLSQILERI
ncbi:hypothetical protein LJB42_001509 [Komagataella kurtzmanii]|nr:hypothetical protein LJB42_001509 [Komagataella kurtzmanii]